MPGCVSLGEFLFNKNKRDDNAKKYFTKACENSYEAGCTFLGLYEIEAGNLQEGYNRLENICSLNRENFTACLKASMLKNEMECDKGNAIDCEKLCNYKMGLKEKTVQEEALEVCQKACDIGSESSCNNIPNIKNNLESKKNPSTNIKLSPDYRAIMNTGIFTIGRRLGEILAKRNLTNREVSRLIEGVKIGVREKEIEPDRETNKDYVNKFLKKQEDTSIKLGEKEMDLALLAYGRMSSEKLSDLSITDKELNYYIEGFKLGISGEGIEVDRDANKLYAQIFLNDRIDEAMDFQKKESDLFIKKFLKNERRKKTKSGLCYEIINLGKGKFPQKGDKVEIHFKGTLLNGSILVDTFEKDKALSVELDRLTKGVGEGVQLIKEGGRIKLIIPSDLTYGRDGHLPTVPRGATLIYEVELVKIINE